MRTAEERAKEFCDRFTGLDNNFRHCIVILLKQQDLYTRYACAEAIASMYGEVMPGKNDLYISKDRAHSACMNVKAI